MNCDGRKGKTLTQDPSQFTLTAPAPGLPPIPRTKYCPVLIAREAIEQLGFVWSVTLGDFDNHDPEGDIAVAFIQLKHEFE